MNLFIQTPNGILEKILQGSKPTAASISGRYNSPMKQNAGLKTKESLQHRK